MERAKLQEGIARLIALAGLATNNGAYRGMPETWADEEQWKARVLECIPVEAERRCRELADQILDLLDGQHAAVDTAGLLDVLAPFAEEAERQDRRTSYRDGGCIIVRPELTIGALRRAQIAHAKALGQDAEGVS